MDDNRNSKGLLIGILAGGLAGAAIALLYAPKSGREMRDQIRNKKDELLDDTSEYLQIAKTKASDMINEGKRRSEELITDAKKKASTLIGDANTILNEAKQKATNTLGTAKEKLESETGKIIDPLKSGLDAFNQEKNKS